MLLWSRERRKDSVVGGLSQNMVSVENIKNKPFLLLLKIIVRRNVQRDIEFNKLLIKYQNKRKNS
jgi:hypothetical protein